MIRAIVFDFDGTLVESDAIKRSGFDDVTSHVPGAAAALVEIFDDPNVGDRYDIFATLAGRLGAQTSAAAEWTAAYGELCERRILDLLARSDVSHILERLRSKGYTLFVATATPGADLASTIEKSSLASLFAGIYGRPQSKPRILRDILRRHGWGAQEAVMVGNNEDDRKAAAEVGCHFVGVASAQGSFRTPPETVVRRLDELPDALGRLAAAMPAGVTR